MALHMLSRVQVSVPQSTFSPTRPRAVLIAPIAARLHHGASRCVTAVPVRSTKLVSKPVARRGAVTTRAAELKWEVAPEQSRDYAPLIGIIALATHMYGKATLNAPLLLKTLALYQMAIAAIALLFKRIELDNLASVVAPAVLAVNTLQLSQVSYMDAAITLFGYYLCEHLEGPFWLWIATLAGAIYAGYPSHWYVAAFALWAGTRLVRGGQNDKVPVLCVPTLAAAAYAFYKDITPQFTIALIVGQVAASALKYIESVSDS